jgi:signal transduction histidine kinase
VEEVFNSLKSRVSEGGRKLIISPIYSLGILRAVVVVRHPDTNLDSDSRTLFINTLARTFLWVIERDRLLSIFRQVQQPINFKQSEAGYFSSLMGLIRTASQMPFIAIREYDRNEKTLRCIAQSGFRDLPQGALDLLDLSSGRFQPFTECVNKQKVCVATSYSDCPEIFDRVGKYGIKSFLVAPILVGDDIFGTVSFACAIENYEFSMLETAGFVAIANSVGLSITNFRSFHSQVEDERETAVRDMALYAVELAQYARHDARDHIEEGEAILEKLIKLVRRVDGAEKLTEAIRQKFRDLTAAMERIKEATAAPSEEIRPCLLKDVWETAFSGVQYKLDQKDIEWNVNGIAKDTATVFASSDHLRLTFAQLILNSYDAFLAQGAKVKNKHIRVDIGDPGSRANSYVIKYSDNAGGIDPSKLRRKTAGEFAESLAPEEQGVGAIFNRGVTSKLGKQGSGYGLFLARKRLRDVDGSIDIVDYRGGTTVFEIRLPKAQSADLKAAGRVS